MGTKVEGDNVTIDINHPLAGVALNFDINVLSVREATKEELGHAHSHEGVGHSHWRMLKKVGSGLAGRSFLNILQEGLCRK